VHALDPDLTRAVIAAESGGNPVSVSPKGARGVMQLMPRTASMLGVRNAFNPVENISGGTRYLRSLYDRFGRLDLVLWAYNAGPGAVERGRLPEETRTYIRNVYDHLKRFRNR
jgi:soluble lytic murein transglycosylase-like protein